MGASDGALWRRVRTGDEAAFGALFERHGGAIYNYCFSRTADWAAAEDLASIVFLEAWRHREQDIPGEKVLPWLYGVALNVFRNQRRSERRYAAAFRRLPPPRPEPDFADAAEQRINDEREMQRGLTLLQELPQHEQDVFVLCAWMELSYEDAATALSVPVGTVRSRLSRARERLLELDRSYGHIEGEEFNTTEAPP
jgi:RNA polymerase sigma-70 factor, ECF subfamily